MSEKLATDAPGDYEARFFEVLRLGKYPGIDFRRILALPEEDYLHWKRTGEIKDKEKIDETPIREI